MPSRPSSPDYVPSPESPISKEAWQNRRTAARKLSGANTSARTFIVSNDLPVYVEWVPTTKSPHAKTRQLDKKNGDGSGGKGQRSQRNQQGQQGNKRQGRWRVHWDTDSLVSRCHPGNRSGLYNSKGGTTGTRARPTSGVGGSRRYSATAAGG